MKTRFLAAVALINSVCGCRDSGSDYTFGAPITFRLAQVDDSFGIGIDLEIRIPAGYRTV